MSNKNKGLGRRAVASLVAFLLGLFGLASAAFAAPGVGNIDTARSGSITIHKHEHQEKPATQNPDGSSPVLSKPIAEVEFTIFPLLKDGKELDMGKTETWNGLKDLKPGADCSAPAGYTKGSGTVVKTDAAGVAKVENLKLGMYLVCETNAPAQVIKKAAPFLVAIPHPHNNTWIYDVHVYPKNAVGVLEKTIKPQTDLGLGSIVSFPVTAQIPRIAPNDDFTSFAITDKLDPRLQPAGVASVKVGGVDVNPSYYTVTTTGQTISVDFTAAGLTWLKSQGGKSVEVVFNGKVIKVGDGVITNDADLFVNDPHKENGKKSNKVHTNWGKLRIKKTDSHTTPNPLEGAEFQVFEAAEPYAATCGTATKGQPVKVNGKDVFVSGKDGIVNIDGLFVSDSKNEPIDAKKRCYVLVETKAPAGYVTPAGDKAKTAVEVKIGERTDVDVTIANVPQDVPELPLTGSSGAVIMSIVGLGLAGTAVVLLVVSRSRALNK